MTSAMQRWTAFFIPLFCIGCHTTGDISTSAPVIEKPPSVAGRKNVELSYHGFETPVSWCLESEYIREEAVIPRLEKCLRELGQEGMYVTILSPMEDSPVRGETIESIERWAKEHEIPLRHERSFNHIRGVTFGRPISKED